MSADLTSQTRVSWLRVGVLILAMVALVAGARWVMAPGLAIPTTPDKPFFAGYVDVTATPAYAFESPQDAPQSDVILAFIVGGKDDPCQPTWGTYYTLETAATALDLDRRIAQLRSIGGNVSISFGGQINDELAVGCQDETALITAYRDVVDRYQVQRIDLDIEGPALTDAVSLQRRARVIAALQAEQEDLEVWLTLPVATQGLTADGLAALQTTMAGGVDVSGVNGMTMNFGGSRASGASMASAVVDAANALHGQLRTAFAGLDDAQVWARLGITPMIGQNDLPGEVFTLDDATTVNQFALERGVGLVSMWSLNRDFTCAPPLPKTVTVVQTDCSGVNQAGNSFAMVLANDAETALPTASPEPTVEDPEVVDDPKTSPFPIWDPVGTYPADTRVVWKKKVYRAKYWTSGISPDAGVATQDSPWILVGPVLPGDRPAPLPTLPADTYPQWKAAETYTQGQRVQVGKVGYQAKWWTRGQKPGEAVAGGSPWLLITPS
jgi:chitinase